MRVLGKLTTAKGKTVREALTLLKVTNARGTSVITVTHGDKTKERILNTVQTQRLFNTAGFSREIAIKNTSVLFEGL